MSCLTSQVDSRRRLTKLTLHAPAFGAGDWEAGGYVFLNMPAIAGAQWHPFTVSSPPHEHAATGELTLHILAVDDESTDNVTFTGQVCKWANQRCVP